MSASRVAWMLGLIVWGSTISGTANAGHGIFPCLGGKCCHHHRGHCCHGPHGCCCAAPQEKDSRRSGDARSDRSMPMVLPIIETVPVFAAPVVLASQRTYVTPQAATRASMVRPEEACASQERLERLENKVADLADSFDELKEVVLQQARILNEISKRLPEN